MNRKDVGAGEHRRSSAAEQLAAVAVREEKRKSVEDEEARRIVPRLANRSYHLHGNSWCDDWVQYMLNNHPVLGICCAHRLHPLKKHARFVLLIGSIACGLAITNLVYLWFVRNDENMDELVWSFNVTAGANQTDFFGIPIEYTSLDVTRGMIVLWTAGSAAHSLYDHAAWSLSACKCCRPGGSLGFVGASGGCCQSAGLLFLVVPAVVVTVAVATLVVAMRASLSDDDITIRPDEASEGAEETPPGIDWGSVKEARSADADSFSFLLGYTVEFALAVCVYWPLTGTVFFSGILGCGGRLPYLGGRPRAIRLERKALEMQRDSTLVAPTAETKDDASEGIP